MMQRVDSYKHQGLRRQMVEELRSAGIADEEVLRAIDEVPRHWFLDSALDGVAYQDRAFPIACGQTISRPSTVARQTQLLQLQRGMKVLEIGTGSGYQTAVLCRMGARVFTVELQRDLYDRTSKLLAECGYRAQCFRGDGNNGLSGQYDRILVTCGSPEVPETLLRQLKPGGIMVIPIGGDEGQEMLRITKAVDSAAEDVVERFGKYSFVPMLNRRQVD